MMLRTPAIAYGLYNAIGKRKTDQLITIIRIKSENLRAAFHRERVCLTFGIPRLTNVYVRVCDSLHGEMWSRYTR